MKNVLIIVDAQNDFCHGKGALQNEDCCKTVKHILELVNNDNNVIFDKIVCTMDTHYAYHYLDTTEGRHLPVKHCIEGTWGWKLNESLYQALYWHSNVSFLQKSRFAPDSVELWKHIGITDRNDNVFICGFCTDICVVSTAITVKSILESEVYVIEKCCAGSTLEKHCAAIRTMESCHINIIKNTTTIPKEILKSKK